MSTTRKQFATPPSKANPRKNGKKIKKLIKKKIGGRVCKSFLTLLARVTPIYHYEIPFP
jgi:hypothetical protein